MNKSQLTSEGISLVIYPEQESAVLQEVRDITGGKSVDDLLKGIIVLSHHILKKDIPSSCGMVNRIQQRKWSIPQVAKCVQTASSVKEMRCKGVKFNYTIVGSKGNSQRAVSIAFERDDDMDRYILIVTVL